MWVIGKSFNCTPTVWTWGPYVEVFFNNRSKLMPGRLNLHNKWHFYVHVQKELIFYCNMTHKHSQREEICYCLVSSFLYMVIIVWTNICTKKNPVSWIISSNYLCLIYLSHCWLPSDGEYMCYFAFIQAFSNFLNTWENSVKLSCAWSIRECYKIRLIISVNTASELRNLCTANGQFKCDPKWKQVTTCTLLY